MVLFDKFHKHLKLMQKFAKYFSLFFLTAASELL